ncbi:hypothetical protein BV20DRAFT_353063 [Pilatotrama ljubarskyi]|nr:hypothetical protein BV20DRAFT_353063 [Pilatotrama ljubarskyi]
MWPPHLTAILLEGLEKCIPPERKSSRGFSRFPGRNKFVSEYIFQKTGERRTIKQVDSRIEALEATAGLTQKIAMDFDTPPGNRKEMLNTGNSSKASERTVFSSHATGGAPAFLGPLVQVFIPVPPTSDPAGSTATPTHPGRPDSTQPAESNISSQTRDEFADLRPLHMVDPTVTFASGSALPLISRCIVYRDNMVIHVGEAVTMSIEPSRGQYLHHTNLAPGYWHTLCGCEDPSPYTIVQHVTTEGEPTGVSSSIIVVEYHFGQSTSGRSPFTPPSSTGQEMHHGVDSGVGFVPL